MMTTTAIYDLSHDEAAKLARVLVEHRTDIESIKRASGSYKFEGKEHAGTYKVACCIICLGPVWRSTSKADVDDWKIDDWPGNLPFDCCSSCDGNLSMLGPIERQAMEDMGAGHAIALGRTLVRLNHYRPNPETALDLISAAASRP